MRIATILSSPFGISINQHFVPLHDFQNFTSDTQCMHAHTHTHTKDTPAHAHTHAHYLAFFLPITESSEFESITMYYFCMYLFA